MLFNLKQADKFTEPHICHFFKLKSMDTSSALNHASKNHNNLMQNFLEFEKFLAQFGKMMIMIVKSLQQTHKAHNSQKHIPKHEHNKSS